MTKSAFYARYPEFSPAETDFAGMVDAALLEAAAAISDQWGDKFDQVHGLETAHRLALSPFGRTAKLSTDDGESTYSRQLYHLRIGAMALLGRLG